MPEVKVLDEDLNGLGWTLKSLVDANLDHADVRKAVAGIEGSLVVTERDASVSVTLSFHKGDLAIRNGAAGRPSASLSGAFEQLSEIISGQIGPIRALLTGRIKARGNLFTLLRMARAIISRDKS